MSNCIFFHRNHEVRFSPFDISVMRLRELINDCPSKLPDWEKDSSGAMVWWFLKTCTTFDDHGALIAFGRGRSGHTWRDFRGVVNTIIMPIMLRTKEHTFLAEDPGFPGKFRLRVIFGERME